MGGRGETSNIDLHFHLAQLVRLQTTVMARPRLLCFLYGA